MDIKNFNPTISFGILGLATLVFTTLSFFVGTGRFDTNLNLALWFASMALGWVIGTFASPDNKSEERRFSGWAKAISGFITGYAVSKLDKAIESLLSPGTLAS